MQKTNVKYKGRKATLSDEQVKEISGRVKNKECIARIAHEYGVSRQTIYRCLRARCRYIGGGRNEYSFSEEKNLSNAPYNLSLQGEDIRRTLTGILTFLPLFANR